MHLKINFSPIFTGTSHKMRSKWLPHRLHQRPQVKCAADIVKRGLLELLRRSGPIWGGGEASKTHPASGIELGCICSLLIHPGIGLHYTHRACTVLWLLKPHLLSNILAPEKQNKKTNEQKTTTPSKGFQSQVLAKVLNSAAHAFGLSNYPLMHIQRKANCRVILVSHSLSGPLRVPVSEKEEGKTGK